MGQIWGKLWHQNSTVHSAHARYRSPELKDAQSYAFHSPSPSQGPE